MDRQCWFESRALVIAITIFVVLSSLYLLTHMIPYIDGIFGLIGHVLAPFGLAILLSYLLRPIVLLMQRLGLNNFMSIILTYVLLISISVFVAVKILPELQDELQALWHRLPNWRRHLLDTLPSSDGQSFFYELLQTGASGLIYELEAKFAFGSETTNLNIHGILNLIFILLTTPFLAFYMLKDSEYIKTLITAAFPKTKQNKVLRILSEIDESIGHYLRSQLIVGTIVGILSFVGYLLIGLKYALLLALIVAILNIIPYFGPIIGAIPAVLVAADSSFQTVIWVLVINFVIQLIEGNVILPYIIGRSLNIHPLLIIIAVIVGGEALGVWGLILAVPILAVLKVISKHCFVDSDPTYTE